jgi:hypothetical protein
VATLEEGTPHTAGDAVGQVGANKKHGRDSEAGTALASKRVKTSTVKPFVPVRPVVRRASLRTFFRANPAGAGATSEAPIPQDVIDDLSEYHLVHWAETHTVVCTKCPTPTVLWQTNAASHWRTYHVADTFAPARPINTLLTFLPNIAARDSEVLAPKSGLPARLFLAPAQPGFQCPFCEWACLLQKKFREHLTIGTTGFIGETI